MKKIIAIFLGLAFITILAATLYLVLREKPNPNELVLYGNVDVRQVDIGFRVAGQVNKLYFEEGDFVKKGQIMASLNKSPYDSQINAAKANVASIEANLENAEILLSRRLLAVSIGGVSKEAADDATYSAEQLSANLEAAKASLAIAVDNMAYTEAFAPSDGIILSRIREEGTVVNPTDPVYTLSITSPVWIRAYIDEPHLGLICYGMPANIYTDSGKVYTGKVGFISPVAEFTPKTVETIELRTDLVYRLRIYADNPDCYLKQGMPVTVKLHLNQGSTP